MSRFPYFGSVVHSFLYYLKENANDGISPDFASVQGRVEDIVRTHARHIPADFTLSLMPYETKLLARYWKTIYKVLDTYDAYWLKHQIDGRKHDIIGVKDNHVTMVDIVTVRNLRDVDDITSEHIGFQNALTHARQTGSLLEYACKTHVTSRVLVLCNDLANYHKPVWRDTTDWFDRRSPSTRAAPPLMAAVA